MIVVRNLFILMLLFSTIRCSDCVQLKFILVAVVAHVSYFYNIGLITLNSV